MTADEITAIVESEIAGDWSRSNDHGVDLRNCLVPPTKMTFQDSFHDGDLIELWLVLEERPKSLDGYMIVFGEQRRAFGLSTHGADSEAPIFLGYYGTFLETLEGM